MQKIIDTNKKNLATMLSIVKISIVIFSIIIIYINLPKYWINMKIRNNGEFNLYTSAFFLCATAVCYFIWIIVNNKVEQYSNIFKLNWLIENIIFISIISLPIYMFMAYESEYKYLFLLLIIFSTIQYGSKYGIITSLLSSLVVLIADLLYAPLSNGINVYFQRDLIMAGVFIVVGWVLGYYVDIEAINNEKKDEKLNKLSNKLEEKKRQREEMKVILLNNEICYDILFENSLNAIIVHNEGKIIYANKSALNLLGYNEFGDVDKKRFYEYYSEDDQLNIKNKYLDIINKRRARIVDEEKIFNCHGKAVPVRNTSSFFVYKEEATILTFLVDITSEKKIETLESDIEENIKLLNKTKEFNFLIRNFFTNMSHELKTPVNVIYSAIQMIGMDLQECNETSIEKRELYLKVMKQNCLRMSRLINNFLDTTKLDARAIKLNKINANIVETIEDIVQSVINYVKNKGIQLIFDTDVEEKIMGFDKEIIKRILLNLLSNAIKFSDNNKKIYINLINRTDSIVIKVKDEGKGIPSNKLGIIFERFGQANYSLSRECEGSGIGLYLVKSFVELHKGNIEILSEEGNGTEVIIELPAQMVENKEYIEKIIGETNEEKIEREFSDIYTI